MNKYLRVCKYVMNITAAIGLSSIAVLYCSLTPEQKECIKIACRNKNIKTYRCKGGTIKMYAKKI